MSNIPLPRLYELLHENKDLVIDSIYGKVIQEHYQNEHKKVREAAYITFRGILTVGAIKTGKTDIYLP